MAEIPDDTKSGSNGFDPAIQTENIAFDQADLVNCTDCGRKNPPNRLHCLYCGRDLEQNTELALAVKTERRNPEAWESGFNIVFVEARSDASIENAARSLSLDNADLQTILDSGCSLPVARVAKLPEAETLLENLKALGLICLIVSDANLNAEKPPTRLRNMDVSESGFGLMDFNTGAVTSINFDEIAVIVPGFISSSRVDTLEKRRRNKEPKLLDETATATDDPILDIYCRYERQGFRVFQTGFDFSCLGADKGILATENLRRLMVMLKESSPKAKVVGNYAAVRYVLGLVWEIDSRRDSKGLVQVGFGKREFGATSSTSNLIQFTKFSRLQQHLL